MRNAFTILVRKSEEKKSLGRPRWKDNTKMDLREIMCESVDWTQLAQKGSMFGFVKTVLNLWDPKEAGNFLIS
jgi:hypothetical protein